MLHISSGLHHCKPWLPCFRCLARFFSRTVILILKLWFHFKVFMFYAWLRHYIWHSCQVLESASVLRASAALAKDLGLGPSLHAFTFRETRNTPPSGLSRHRAHTQDAIYMHTCHTLKHTKSKFINTCQAWVSEVFCFLSYWAYI